MLALRGFLSQAPRVAFPLGLYAKLGSDFLPPRRRFRQSRSRRLLASRCLLYRFVECSQVVEPSRNAQARKSSRERERPAHDFRLLPRNV